MGDSHTMTAAFLLFLHYNEENSTNSFFRLRCLQPLGSDNICIPHP